MLVGEVMRRKEEDRGGGGEVVAVGVADDLAHLRDFEVKWKFR